MQEYYLKSLQMIKNLNIRNKKEYNKLLSNYLLLNIESLKYYANTRSFKKIVEKSKEAFQTSFLFGKNCISTIVDVFYYIYKSKLQINKEEKKEMNVVENDVKELSDKYNRSVNFIKMLLKICMDLKISDYKNEIENFLNNH